LFVKIRLFQLSTLPKSNFNFLKSLARIIILLIVAFLSVFIYFKPEDLSNAEVVTDLLTLESWEFIRLHQKTTPPVGINQDWNNYTAIFFYLLISFDLYRKNSIVKLVAEKFGENSVQIKLNQLKGFKYFVPFTFCASAFALIVSIFSFFKFLPDILTYAEWTKTLRLRSSYSGTIQVWSSGWSLLLCEFSTILCHAGVLRLILKFRRLKTSNI
jgi:hypothetical protein